MSIDMQLNPDQLNELLSSVTYFFILALLIKLLYELFDEL